MVLGKDGQSDPTFASVATPPSRRSAGQPADSTP